MQRVMLGMFGFVLAMPLIWSAYAMTITGTPGSLFSAPSVPDTVESHVSQDGSTTQENYRHLARNPIRLVRLSIAFGEELAQTNDRCEVVESFGLNQRNIRQLKSPRFQGKVFVYVGDVHALSREPSLVHVFIGDQGAWQPAGRLSESEFDRRFASIAQGSKWTLPVRSRGDSTYFEYDRQRYRLTVTQVFAVLFGTDKIAVEICREAQYSRAFPERRPPQFAVDSAREGRRYSRLLSF